MANGCILGIIPSRLTGASIGIIAMAIAMAIAIILPILSYTLRGRWIDIRSLLLVVVWRISMIVFATAATTIIRAVTQMTELRWFVAHIAIAQVIVGYFCGPVLRELTEVVVKKNK